MTTTTVPGVVTSVDGTTIAYEHGGHGPPLVLVDGVCCHRGFGPLPALAARLAPHHTVFTYDRRGRGASGDVTPYDPACEVEDLAALIAETGGCASIYGVSSGALLAIQAAAAGLAIPRLALFEPPIDASAPDVPTVVAELQSTPFRSELEAVAHTVAYDVTISASTTRDLLQAVTVPTLVLHGGGASEPPPWVRAVVDALPDGRHRSVSGERHDLPAAELAPILLDFFAS